MARKVYKVEVTELQDKGNFFLKQGSSNIVQDPTAPSNHRATYIVEATTDAKFDTFLSAIDSAAATAES